MTCFDPLRCAGLVGRRPGVSQGPLLSETVEPSCWHPSFPFELDGEYDKQQRGSAAHARQRNSCAISAPRAVRGWRPIIRITDVATRPPAPQHHRATEPESVVRLLCLVLCVYCFSESLSASEDGFGRASASVCDKVSSAKVLGARTAGASSAQSVEPSAKENCFRTQAPSLTH